MVVVIAIMSVFVLAGLGMLWSGLSDAYRSVCAGAWPTTRAAITDLGVREVGVGRGTNFEVHVRYRYTVQGVGFSGSRLAFGYRGSNSRAAV